jgi:uncharacterized RDD family membrane protein YckC
MGSAARKPAPGGSGPGSAASGSTAAVPAATPAALLRRLAALVYDTLLLLAVLFVATFLVLPLTGGEAVPAGSPGFRSYLFLVAFLYFALPWTRSGQTLGLKAWRLRVERQDGGRLTPWDALWRFLAGALALLPLGVGLLWVLVDRDRLAWHDRLSGTRVVRVFEPAGPRRPTPPGAAATDPRPAPPG